MQYRQYRDEHKDRDRHQQTTQGPSQGHRETGGQQAARQPADRTHPPRARSGRARHPGPPPAQRLPARPPRLAPPASPHHPAPPASFLRSALPTAQPEHPIPGPAIFHRRSRSSSSTQRRWSACSRSARSIGGHGGQHRSSPTPSSCVPIPGPSAPVTSPASPEPVSAVPPAQPGGEGVEGGGSEALVELA